MRVALLAYLLHRGESYRAAGVSTYSEGLLRELPRECPEHEYVAFHGKDAPPLDGARSVESPLPTQHALARIAWEQTGSLLQIKRVSPDLMHGLVNVLPLSSRIPSVVTVHDLAFLRHPERFHRLKVAYLRSAVHLSVRKARHVIAVSGSTRNDLIELLALSPDHVSIIYPGLNPRFHRLAEVEINRFRVEATGGRPYILYVGTLEPRKNVDILIRAFHQLRLRADIPHQLVLVGAPGWMYDNLFQLVHTLQLDEHVKFAGYTPADDLPLWYNAADLFAYPSAYEGFGFPVVEAMACGAPTVTSSSSSLKEVAGSACLTVEVGSQEALLMALSRLLENAELRINLREAGLERAQHFTWQRAARETVAVYERVHGA